MEQLVEELKKEIKDNRIMLYMKGTKEQPMCGFSRQVVNVLNVLGADFTTRNALENPDLRPALREVSQWPTFPQLFIEGEFIGGCDIITEMYNTGELQPLVNGAEQQV